MHAAISSPSSAEIIRLKRDLAEACLRAATLYVDVLRAEVGRDHPAVAAAQRVVEFRTVQHRALSERATAS